MLGPANSSEYRQSNDKHRILHQSEYVETKKALDEQSCAHKDAIDAINREALNESNSLKHVINNVDTHNCSRHSVSSSEP